MAKTTEEKGRIAIRVPIHIQETVQRAAELMGTPVNAYIVQVMHQHALDIIDRYDMKNIMLSEPDAAIIPATTHPPSTAKQQAQTGICPAYRTLHDVTDHSSAPADPSPA
ncbi:MAG: DUF1778 domain-containing protein [Rivihabitans pingtungensis]